MAVAGTVLYTCPAGETAIIKSLTAGPGAVGGNTLGFYIGTVTAANLLYAHQLNLGDWEKLDGLFWVLQPGQVLRGTSTSGAARTFGFGAELEGVAD